MFEDIKQVIVVRSDLNMSKGKFAVQVAHASVDSAIKALRGKDQWRRWFDEWLESGMKKIVVKVSSETDLYNKYRECLSLDIPCTLIRDAGKTELEPGTPTAVGIGPAPSKTIDRITGALPLYR